MSTGFDRGGPAVVMEAVLHTDQLADVRRMLELRLDGVDAESLWQVVTATNELVTNALVHCGRCLGLRVYLSEQMVRIEVDDTSPARIVRGRTSGGLAIVDHLASSWGDLAPGPPAEAGGRDQRPGGAAKTVWCEIDV